jgi:energy-coupling factor transport system ATP-binding protein
MNKEEVMLSCDGLSFRYSTKEEPVFSNLSLTVRKGETVLLMGPSGCGKSTLAYCLAGLYPEYAGELQGEILLDGSPMCEYGPARRAQTASILFQNPDNQFCMDRVENEVLFALENMNYQGNLRERAKELLAQVGLEQAASSLIHTLSGGMKQKLALCTALATGAKMLILDEPFANLDPDSCASLAALLREMNEQGLTLLIVDHRLDWWLPFLSRIVLFEKTGNLDEGAILPEKLTERKEDFTSRGLFLGNEWLEGRKPPRLSKPEKIMVKAEELTLLHGRKPFLTNLSFQMEKGSITSLVGSCGSGKTTLLQAIAGIGRHKGKLYTAGKAGLVFQNPRFQFLSLSVEEEVLITLRASRPGKSQDEKKAEAEELLREFGLLEWKKQSPYALSQGQQRRLALLAMLAADCPLMLLDEPTYAQDERSTRWILDLLEKRVAEGLTVIMATHDPELAEAVSNRILRIEGGKLTEQKGGRA